MLVVNWKMGKENPVFEDAFMIRTSVFVEEQGFSDEMDSLDETAWHLVIYDNARPVACGRLFAEEENTAHVGRIAVLPEWRGKHIGALLMKEMEEKAVSLGYEKIRLGAQCRAADFYKKQGYSPYGEEYLDEFCPHIMMEKPLSFSEEANSIKGEEEHERV